jgi:RHS repeat-associated protein
MRTFQKISVSVITAAGVLAGSAFAQVGNDNPTGTSGQFNGNVTTGCSYDPYTANATRSITDLVVAGGVGSYPLAFTRTMNSRYTAGVPAPFGAAGNWNHSYGWSIDSTTVTGTGRPARYDVNYPDGRRVSFSNGGSDPNFRGPPGVRDRFKRLSASSPNDCYLKLPDGGDVHFRATSTTAGGNTTYRFSLVEIIDPYGQTTTITYPNGTMVITEHALRSITIFYAQGPAGDTVVDHVTGSDGRTVQYSYSGIYEGATLYTALTSVVYFPGQDPSPATATYTYQPDNIAPTGRPLIATCVDPMLDGPMWKIAYGIMPNGSGVVSGQLQREKHPSGTPVSTLAVTSTTMRTEIRGDNPTGTGNPSRTFTYSNYLLTATRDFKNAIGRQAYDPNTSYLQSVTDRNSNVTEYTCHSLNGNTRHVKYPDTPGDTLPNTPTMALTYTYGDASNDDPNNDNPDNPYYLFSVRNGRNFVNKYYRDGHKRVKGITFPDGTGEIFTYDNLYGQKLTHTLRDFTSVEKWEYNDSAHPGQVTAFFDAANTTATPTTRFIYDSYGRVWKTTDGRGNAAGDPKYTIVFEYNLRGQVTKTIHPDNTFIESRYNPDGTIQWTKDELGHTTTYTYDDYKRVRTVTTPLRSPTDQLPRTTTTYYDDSTQCSQGQCADNYTRTDAKPTRVTSPGGKTTTTSYDENLRTLSVKQVGDLHVPSGTTYYSYDANGNREIVTDPNGNITRTYYDKQNRVKFIDDPMVNDPNTPHRNSDGYSVSYIYDEGGNKIRERRVDSKICKYTYNNMGRLETKSGFAVDTTQDPFPDIVTYEYNRMGSLKTITDPLGREYKYTNDALGRRLTAEYPKDASGTARLESWHYDIANHLDSYTNPTEQVQTLKYDARGRLTHTSWDTGGPAVTTAYDAASRPLSIGTSEGSVVSYHYDDANNKIWEEQSIGGQPAAQPVQPMSAVSRKTHHDPNNSVPDADYDINLPLTGSPGVECRVGPDYKVIIDFPSVVTFSSASLTGGTGSISSTTGNGSNEVTVNLTGVTNGQTITVALWNATDGVVTGDVYVQMGVLLGDVNGNRSVNSSDVSEVEDQSGHAVTSSNFRDDVTLTNSINSSDVSTVQPQSGTALPQIGGGVHRVQTDPDADGNRTDLVVTTGGTTNYSLGYQYTSRSGIWQISDANHAFTYHYGDANGNIAQRDAGTLQSSTYFGTTGFSYDPLNRPTLATQTGQSGVLETVNYEYTRRGGLRDVYRNVGGVNVGDFYTYDDNRDQLINAKYSATGVTGPNPQPLNPVKTVAYDCGAIDRNGMTITDSGGTTNVSYTKADLNQYKQVTVNQNSQTLSYDNNFNLTGYDGWTYTYDSLNRLLSATLLGTSPHSARFVYDGTGRCVKRTIDGVETVFTYDGWRQIAEWSGSGALLATNIYGIGIDEILYRWSSASGNLFYKSDALGNVRYLLNGSGALVEQYAYDAFGAATMIDANGQNPHTVSNFDNRFMYKGREYLDALGIYDFRSRMYHAGLGRFFQSDPIGLSGDPLNLFRFCGHNPLTGSDPMGEDYASDLVNFPASDYVSADPAYAYPSFYTDQGAWDTSLADVNFALLAPWMPDATLNFSGSAPTQIDNMGMWKGTMPGQDGPGIQPGVGPLYNRIFDTTITGSTMGASALMAGIKSDINQFGASANPLFDMVFHPVQGSAIMAGNTFQIANPPADVLVFSPAPQVVVSFVGNTTLMLTTMSGHPEAGSIIFSAFDSGPSQMTFRIESLFQAGNSSYQSLYGLGGQTIQTGIWINFSQNVINYTGGTGTTTSTTHSWGH